MKVEVLIDGYNFLRARAGVRLTSGPGGLHRAREALLRWLAQRCPNHHSITVIFDASLPTIPFSQRSEQVQYGIRVRFAHHHPDADTLIAELIAAHHSPKQLLVVSNDRAVQRSAKRRGAQPISCEAFESHLIRQAQQTPDQREQGEKSRSPSAKERAYWLEIFGNETSLFESEPSPLPKRIEPPLPSPPPSSPKPELKKPPQRKRPMSKKKSQPQAEEKEIPNLNSLADFYQAMRAAEKEDNLLGRDDI
jgi:predicted RNA-binding protein with PIN domain